MRVRRARHERARPDNEEARARHERAPCPSRFNQPRGSSPGHFTDNKGFDGPQPVVRPLRHKGGLLPTPPEGLINLLNNSPEAFREEQWRNSHLTDTRRTSLPREDCEIRNYRDRESHSEERGRARDRGNFQLSAPRLSQERQLPEDNRREWGGSHGRQRGRGTGRPMSRESGRVRGREADRSREEVGEKQKTPTENDKDIGRATSMEGDANRVIPSLHKRSLSKDSDRNSLKDGSGKKEEEMGGNGNKVESTDALQTDTPQESKGPA
ncbi:unnamed protein product [Coregonus sp. 'balchen']|nr:unnamed protein product [Coregonus sp. 'balchen']